MWSYIKNKKDYTIKYTNENDGKCFSFQLPFQQDLRDTIMYWDEKRIQIFINELNDGNVVFETPIFTNFDDDTDKMGFKITTINNGKLEINKIYE